MSLNSLAYSAVLAATPKGAVRPALPAAAQDVTEAKDVENALSALVEYLPAETVSLYLASIAALPALAAVDARVTAAAVYWFFAGATPILFFLIWAGKRAAAGLPRLPKQAGEWPWWSMVAATVAFLAWALAVPNGPYLADESGRVVAGLLAMFVSVVLGVFGRFFTRSGG